LIVLACSRESQRLCFRRFLVELFVGRRTEVLLNNHAPPKKGFTGLDSGEMGWAGFRFKGVNEMIKKSGALFLFLAILGVTALAQQPAPPKTQLKVGQPAPEFTLTDTEGKEVKLSDFKGKKNVVLAFYVLAFTGG
jgi:hypothetical protein